MSLSSLLPHRITVETLTGTTRDRTGNIVGTFSTTYSGIAAQVSTMKPAQVERHFRQTGSKVSHQITTFSELTTGQRVQVSGESVYLRVVTCSLIRRQGSIRARYDSLCEIIGPA